MTNSAEFYGRHALPPNFDALDPKTMDIGIITRANDELQFLSYGDKDWRITGEIAKHRSLADHIWGDSYIDAFEAGQIVLNIQDEWVRPNIDEDSWEKILP